MRAACFLTFLLLFPGAGLAEDDTEPAGLEWQHEGIASLPAASESAKRAGKRLLIGLSGAPT